MDANEGRGDAMGDEIGIERCGAVTLRTICAHSAGPLGYAVPL